MKFSFKIYLPYLAAVTAFIVLTLVYFKPLLDGKELNQGDITRYKGMSKEAQDFRKAENAEPLWTNSMFGGMPAYQISVIYPGNWLSKIDKAFKLFLPHPSGYIFLCFLGFFILLLCLDIDPWLAIAGSIAYGLTSYVLIILEAGHNSKANAMAYLPPLIGGIMLLLKGRYWLGSALSLLFMALELNANHVQISYYGFILIGIIFATYFYYAYKEKQWKPYFKALGFFVAITLIALLPNAGNLLSTYEYGKYTTRGKTELTINSDLKSNKDIVTSGLNKDYATQWSYGIGETFTFLIPDFKGGGSNAIGESDADALKKVSPDFRQQVANSNAYFGDQPFTSGPVYIGAIVIFLSVLGLFIIKNKLKWALVIATVLTVALSWGSNFMALTNIFMDYVPGYNKFRAVSMILVIAELTLPLLAVLAVHELLTAKSLNDKILLQLFKKEVELKKILIISFAIVGGFCLLGFLAPDLINTFRSTNEEAKLINAYTRGGNPIEQVRQYVTELMPQIETARKAMFTSDAMRSFVFILLAFIFIYMFLLKKIKKEILFAALGIFILIDLWTVDTRYLNEKSFLTKSQNEAQFDKTPADEEILKDTELGYRVLNLTLSTFNDASTSYYHKSIGGYHGAKLKKYQEIIDFHLDKEIELFYEGINRSVGNDSLLNSLFAQLNVLNMLNAKYFILPGGKDGNIGIPLQNPQSNGTSWFVKKIKTVANADSEIVSLYNINTKTEAVIQSKFKTENGIADSYSGNGTIKMLSYKPNYLTYESSSSSDEFAVFSEIYYPKGWNAYIDGTLTPHVCVNYVLRGLPLKAGKHKIEFKFEPQVYKTGNNIAIAGSAILLITVGLCLFMEIKSKSKKA